MLGHIGKVWWIGYTGDFELFTDVIAGGLNCFYIAFVMR